MLKTQKKTSSKDKRYVNKDEDYEVTSEKKRKQPLRKFGKSKEDA